jgi:hypothetical protein
VDFGRGAQETPCSMSDKYRYRVYVGRLARDARTRDVERLFSKYGRIRDIDLKPDYGFVVRFRSPAYDVPAKIIQYEKPFGQPNRSTKARAMLLMLPEN